MFHVTVQHIHVAIVYFHVTVEHIHVAIVYFHVTTAKFHASQYRHAQRLIKHIAYSGEWSASEHRWRWRCNDGVVRGGVPVAEYGTANGNRQHLVHCGAAQHNEGAVGAPNTPPIVVGIAAGHLLTRTSVWASL